MSIKLENKSNRAFKLSLIAGILISINAVLLGAAATWFPYVIPTLPGSNNNDSISFGSLTVIGLICGLVVLLGAVMIHSKSANRTIWGFAVILFSAPSVIMGGGFIVGFILGILGGVYTLQKPKNSKHKFNISIQDG